MKPNNIFDLPPVLVFRHENNGGSRKYGYHFRPSDPTQTRTVYTAVKSFGLVTSIMLWFTGS